MGIAPQMILIPKWDVFLTTQDNPIALRLIWHQNPTLTWWQKTTLTTTVQLTEPARVDLSETFSADQLSFRILSGLFQRCSLPENLWTALIQLWTALKTEIFRAKNQRWFSLKQCWFRAEQRWFPLKQRWTALILEYFRMTVIGLFSTFTKFFYVPQIRGT